MLKKQIELFLKWPKRKKLLVLFIFAFIFRVSYGFYSNSFGQDVSRDLVLAEAKIQQGEWLVGYGPKASVGDFYLPPLYYQTHVLLSGLTNNYPFVMKFFVIVIESLTPVILVLIFELLGFAAFSWALGLIYTIAPIPTIFGTSAWNPNTIPFFASLALLMWLRIINKKSKTKFYWEPLIGTLAVTVAIHFHYQAVIILPFAIGVGIWSFWKQPKSRKFWLLGIALSLLTFLPYVLIEMENNWQNTLAIKNYFTGEHSRYYERVSKPAYFLSFFPSFVERVVTGNNFKFKFLGIILFFVGGFSMAKTSFEERIKQPLHLWLLVYLGSIILMLRVYKGDKLDYYLSALYFLPIILFAYLWKKYRKFAYVLLIFILFNIGLFYGQVERRDGYGELRFAIDFINQELNGGEARYIFHNDDDINTFAYGLSRFGEVRINQNSLLVIDICEPFIECSWNGLNKCDYSRDYTYAAILKSTGEYFPKKILTTNSGMRILIGEFHKTPELTNYPLYLNDLSYGSDTLYPELYE